VAKTTPRCSDYTAHLLNAASLYLKSPPEAANNWAWINPNLNDYHSDPKEIRNTFWIPDITEWWRQQEATHWKYVDLSNVACDRLSITPHGIWVESSFSLGRNVIDWRQSKTIGQTLRETVVVRQFAPARNAMLVRENSVSDTMKTENISDRMKEAEERNLRRMGKVHHFLEMWHGSQNILSTKKESHAQNKQMTAVGYISDNEEIVKASSSLIQHDCAAAFTLSESSRLPPAVSRKDLPEGRTEILNVCPIRRINTHPIESDEDSTHESISDTKNCLNWNRDLDNPNDSKDDCAADDVSDRQQNNGIEDPEGPAQQDVNAAPNVHRLVRPTRKSKRKAEKAVVKVNSIEMRRNIWVKKK